MANIQMTGSAMDLSKGPRDMISTAFGGGSVQMTGSESDLSHETDPMGVFNKGVRGGKTQTFAGTVDLDRTPRRGWESYDTPISDNTMEPQSGTSSYPRGGTRSGR